ncbi:MAG: DUF4398 domain-containing protein [Nevskia sp.]|nr:DUF4398 domain-containing protein [Nevskia sp.]
MLKTASLTARCLGACAALALAACASHDPAPAADAIRKAGDNVAQAEDARASDYAPQEMRAARERLQAALELQRQARNEHSEANLLKARWMAEEASADAKLAEAKSQASRLQGILRSRQREAAPAEAPPPEPGVVPPPEGNTP